MLALLLAALTALAGQDVAPDSRWTVWSEARPEPRVEVARQDEGGWILPPLPAEGTARAVAPFSRERSAVEWEFAFTLSEEAPTSWALTLEHPDGPQEVPLLQLRVAFDPVGGAAWTAAVRDGAGRARAWSLAEPPEPEGLRHHLRLRLPAEGGVDLRLADGHPLCVTPLGTAAAARVVLARRGPVTDLRLRGPTFPPSLVSGELAAFSRSRRGPGADGDLPVLRPDSGWGWSYQVDWLRDLLRFEPLTDTETREVEPVPAGSQVVRRLVVTMRPRVEVPALLWEPAAGVADDAPAVLLLPRRNGAGKTDAWAVQLAGVLAARGCRVLVPDELGQGERTEFQPHDGMFHRVTELVGGRLAAFPVQEVLALLAVLQEQQARGPLVLIGGEGTRLTCLLAAGLTGDLAALVLPPEEDPPASFGAMPPGFARHLEHLAQTVRPRSADGEHVLEATDGSAIAARMAEWFQWPAQASRVPSGPAEDQLLFGPLQVGSLWYSWILEEALQHLESPRRSDSTWERHLWASLNLPGGAPPRQEPALALEPVAPGQDWFRWGRPQDLVWSGLRIRTRPGGPDAPAGALLAEAESPVTLVVAEAGMVEALDRIQQWVEPRPEETWLSLAIPLVGPGRPDCLDPVVRSSWFGTPLVGLLAEDLATFLQQRVREERASPVRLVGQGVGGLLALLVAAQHPECVESVVLAECPPSLALLLDGEPRQWSTGPAGSLRSRHPSSLWFVPDLLANLDLEDLVLALMDASVPVRLERPVDRQLRPLDRRDRHAIWPRVRHREWQAQDGSPDGG